MVVGKKGAMFRFLFSDFGIGNLWIGARFGRANMVFYEDLGIISSWINIMMPSGVLFLL